MEILKLTETEIREDCLQSYLRDKPVGYEFTAIDRLKVDALAHAFITYWQDGTLIPAGRNAIGLIVWASTVYQGHAKA